MNDNPKGAKNPKKPLIVLFCCHAARAYDAQLAAVSELAAAAGDRGRLRRIHLHGGRGSRCEHSIAYDKQDQEITFEATNDKGKDALDKTGIFPDDELVGRLLGANVKFAAEIPTQASPLPSMLISYVVPIVLIIAVGQWLQKKMMKNMGGNMMSFGKSNAKIYAETETGKTFADVAGQDEAKDGPARRSWTSCTTPNKYADHRRHACPRAHCW